MGNNGYHDIRFENLYLDGLHNGGRISWSRKNIKVIRAFCAKHQVSDRNLPTPKLFLELFSDLNVHDRIKLDRECFHNLAKKVLNCIRQYVSKCKEMEGLSERRRMDGKYECTWYHFTGNWADPSWNGDISAPDQRKDDSDWVKRPMIPQRMPGVGHTELIRRTWTKTCDEEQAAAKLKQKSEAEEMTSAIPSDNVEVVAGSSPMDLINGVLESTAELQASEYIKGMNIALPSTEKPAKPSSPVHMDSDDHTGEAQDDEAALIDLRHIMPTLDFIEVVKGLGRNTSDWCIGVDGFAGAKKADGDVQFRNMIKPAPLEDHAVTSEPLSPSICPPVQKTQSKVIEPVTIPAAKSDAKQAKKGVTAGMEQPAFQVQPPTRASSRPSDGPLPGSEAHTTSPPPPARSSSHGALDSAMETDAAEGGKKTSRSEIPVMRKNKDVKEKAEGTTAFAIPATVKVSRTPTKIWRKIMPDAVTSSHLTTKATRISRYRDSSAVTREPVVKGSSKVENYVVEDCEDFVVSNAEKYWLGGTI